MTELMASEILAAAMFGTAILVLMAGYPVAFTLAGVALFFAAIGAQLDLFNLKLLGAMPSRIFGIMSNELLVAVPLFVFMGLMLERARIADQLLTTMGQLFGSLRGGLGVSVILVGMLLAASTGIVGATVVTMGLISLPSMLKAGYDRKLASGVIAASGTLGQIIPPSIVLILLADIMQGSWTAAQREMGIWAPEPLSVVDLFAGALLPGMVLVGLYIAWMLGLALFRPATAPALAMSEAERADLFMRALKGLAPPALLILAVLGSILGGIATPTEAAGVGAAGAMLLAASHGQLSRACLWEVMSGTVKVAAMVFTILIGASLFSLVFVGLGGDEMVEHLLEALPGGQWSALVAVMAVMFILGFFLDFIEIIYVVVPVVAPVLLLMGMDPVWLAIMIAINLQTSFLTPPFGFALFYLRGVAPPEVATADIWKGAIPFIVIQLFALGLLAAFPALATWVPGLLK